MAVEKIHAIILKTLPYRESSSILYLLTEHQGIVHSIAKGLRKQKATTAFFERGFTIECLLYTKPQRDLHTIGSMHVVQFFPALRMNLLCSAIRDTAFETILKTITPAYPYPEIFKLTLQLLQELNMPAEQQKHIISLWRFYRDFVSLTGFGLNGNECLACLRPLADDAHGAHLITGKGGFICNQCSPLNNAGTYFSAPTLQLLFGNVANPDQIPPEITASEARRITRLFDSYCHYHGNTNADNKALYFFETIVGTNTPPTGI